LLEFSKQCKAKIVISGYPSDFYDEQLSEWNRLSKSSWLHSGHKDVKKKAEECVWKNF